MAAISGTASAWSASPSSLWTHKHPQVRVEQALRLAATGDHAVIHHDRSAPDGDCRLIRHALADDPAVAFAPGRFRCGWGEWSLVAVTLSALGEAERSFPEATHFYLLSGDCMPVRFAEYARAFLDRDSWDYIESFDFFESDWIKTGLRAERLVYRYWFDERRHKHLFYASMAAQRRLPPGIRMMIGSQW